MTINFDGYIYICCNNFVKKLEVPFGPIEVFEETTMTRWGFRIVSFNMEEICPVIYVTFSSEKHSCTVQILAEMLGTIGGCVGQ